MQTSLSSRINKIIILKIMSKIFKQNNLCSVLKNVFIWVCYVIVEIPVSDHFFLFLQLSIRCIFKMYRLNSHWKTLSNKLPTWTKINKSNYRGILFFKKQYKNMWNYLMLKISKYNYGASKLNNGSIWNCSYTP